MAPRSRDNATNVHHAIMHMISVVWDVLHMQFSRWVRCVFVIAGFPAKYAVALSNFTIVGGALANLFFNIGRRHSFKPRPLIDWDLILVMEPSTILGALIGGYLNKVCTYICMYPMFACPTHVLVSTSV